MGVSLVIDSLLGTAYDPISWFAMNATSYTKLSYALGINHNSQPKSDLELRKMEN